MKRMLAIVLTAVLLLGMAVIPASAENVVIKIPVYDRGFEGWNVTDNFYTQWIQKEFGDPNGITVQYVAIGRSTEVQDFSQMLAAGNAPDIIFHYDMPQAVAYYGEGAMQVLDLEEIKANAPTYFEMTKDMIETYGYMDGQPMFFFAERPNMGYNWVTIVRKDWMDKVEADMPTNVDELNAMLLKWKEAGLGVLNHQLVKDNYNYSYGFWKVPVDSKEHALYLDLSVADLTSEPTHQYLKNLNYQYNNGLIDKEFYLNVDTNAALAKFLDGSAGTYSFYITSGTTVISSLVANFPEAEVAILETKAGIPEGNEPFNRAYYPFGMIMGVNATTDEATRVALWKFLEWMIQPENLYKLENGVEGENYTLDADGLPVAVADYAGESKRSNNNNKDYWCLWEESSTYGTDELNYKACLRNYAPAGYEDLIATSYEYFVRDAEFGKTEALWQTAVASRNEYKTDLNTLWQELYVKCVMASEDDFEKVYEEACQEYLDAGYQEILDEKTQLIEQGMYR